MSALREPRDLLTVQEVARILHVSDDTVRRQIKEGDLPAIRIGTTPAGRARLRISSAVLEQRLRPDAPAKVDPVEQFRALFADLGEDQREALLKEALTWARSQSAVSMEGRRPQPTAEDLKKLRASRIPDRRDG